MERTDEVTNRGLGALATSPLVAPCIWIAVSTSLYRLHWSNLYPEMQPGVVALLGTTFVAFLVVAATSNAKRVNIEGHLPTTWRPVALITGYFVVAFALNGGIPVLQVLSGAQYDLYGFGISGLHTPMLAFTSYYCLRLLRHALQGRARSAFLAYSWMLVLVAMIASRSAMSFIIFASLVIYLRYRRIGARKLAVGLAGVVALLFIFGEFGNTRLAYQIEQETGQAASRSAVLNYGAASSTFYDTGLDASWMWPYLYLSSPLANLNSANELTRHSLCGRDCSLTGLVVHELMPDVVGSRLAETLSIPEFDKGRFLVAPGLTASTTFGSAVGYAGQLGAFAVVGALLAISLMSVSMLRGSPLREEGLAILATLLFFSFFENMISYSPVSLQLVIVLIGSARIARLSRGSS